MSNSSPPAAAQPGSIRPQPTARARTVVRERGGRSGAALVLPVVSVLGALTIWWLLTHFQVFAPALLPAPGEVAEAAAEMASQGTLIDDAIASFRRAASGFVVGSAIAVAVGALTGRSAIARGLLEPLVQLIRPIPAIALVPLAILWFGLGEESKLFLTSLGVFFPVWINAHTGIAATREDHLRVAASVGASRAQVFGSVVLPSALPFVLTGLRQGIAMSLILIVASEQAGVTAGLGFRLDQARLFSQPDRLFACLAALGIVGALADQVFHRATKGFVAWAAEQS